MLLEMLFSTTKNYKAFRETRKYNSFIGNKNLTEMADLNRKKK